MSRLWRAARLEARLVAHRWDWARENAAAIRRHWEVRRAATPALFNGRVLMASRVEVEAGLCRAEFFETDYASLLSWLDGGAPDRSVHNGFAMGALQGLDGAFVLGRMAAHTANAGRLYFPCGTPDLSDVAGDAVDLAGSLTREIGEETGLGRDDYDVDPDWAIVEAEGLLAFMRRVRLRMTADEARARILRHVAAGPRSELAGALVVRSPADIASERTPPTLAPYLMEAFAREPSRQPG